MAAEKRPPAADRGPDENGEQTGFSPSSLDDAADVPPHLAPVFGDDVERYRRFRRLQAWARWARPFRDVEPVEPGVLIDYLDSPIGVVDAGGLRITSLREWRRCA